MARYDLEIGDEDLEVTRWLEESGRRRIRKGWLENLTTEQTIKEPNRAESHEEQRPSRVYLTQPSSLSLFALLAMCYLFYFFVGVQLEIALMRRIVVFVLG